MLIGLVAEPQIWGNEVESSGGCCVFGVCSGSGVSKLKAWEPFATYRKIGV